MVAARSLMSALWGVSEDGRMDPVESPPPVTPLGQLPPEPSLRGSDSIGAVRERQHVRVGGIVTSAGPKRWAGGTVFECVIDDSTGQIVLAFVGAPAVSGIRRGTHLWADGTVGLHRGRSVILNPSVSVWADAG